VERSQQQKGDDEDLDIEKQIAKEVTELSSHRTTKRKFTPIDTGCSGVIFLRFDDESLPSPIEFLKAIVRDLETTKESKTRFIHRIVPIERTCKASAANIEANCRELAKSFFDRVTSPLVSYCVLITNRNNSSIHKQECLNRIVKLLPFARAVVNLNEPRMVIVVEVCKNLCGVSLVDEYESFHKFSVRFTAPEPYRAINNNKDKSENNAGKSENKNRQKGRRGGKSEKEAEDGDTIAPLIAINEKGEVEVEEVTNEEEKNPSEAAEEEGDDGFRLF